MAIAGSVVSVGGEPTFKFVLGDREEELGYVLELVKEVKVKCSLCPLVCSIVEFEVHKTECDGVVVECGGKQLGCEFSGPRRDLASHEKDCERYKLAPLFFHLTSRISELETKTKELEDANKTLLESSSIRPQISALEMKLSNKFTNRIDGLESTITTFLRSSTMGISYVEFPFPETSSEKDVEIYHGFYKMKVRFGISKGKDSLSVDIGFVRGPFDDMVPEFPFEGKVIFSLLSPKMQPVLSQDWINSEKEYDKEICSSFTTTLWGWENIARMDFVEKFLDGKKMWFSIEVQRK